MHSSFCHWQTHGYEPILLVLHLKCFESASGGHVVPLRLNANLWLCTYLAGPGGDGFSVRPGVQQAEQRGQHWGALRSAWPPVRPRTHHGRHNSSTHRYSPSGATQLQCARRRHGLLVHSAFEQDSATGDQWVSRCRAALLRADCICSRLHLLRTVRCQNSGFTLLQMGNGSAARRVNENHTRLRVWTTSLTRFIGYTQLYAEDTRRYILYCQCTTNINI